jgi:hypothetical protein
VLLILRLVLVPILIAAVTLASRRWGPRVGAYVTALPVVAGPTLAFYAVQQGRVFAADAARGTLLGLVGVAAFCLAYARASTRLHWAWCLLLGWISFAVVTMLISRVPIGPVAALVVAVAALFAARAMLPSPPSSRRESASSAYVCRQTHTSARPRRSLGEGGPRPWANTDRWDLPLRMTSAAVLVFALTSAAERLGSSVSGILTPFPVATAILAGFTHAQRGSAASVEFLRAYTPGLSGFAIFCLVLALTLPRLSIAWSFSAALATQLVVQTLLFRRV